VTQTQLFAGVFLVVHRHGERQVALDAVQHSDATGQHLHSACRELVVEGFSGAGSNYSLNLQHGFAAEMFGDSERFGSQIRVNGDLHRAAAVSEVNEDHPTVIAASIHPAAQLHLLVDGLLSQVAATVAAHGENR